jgi:hypothetical protein
VPYARSIISTEVPITRASSNTDTPAARAPEANVARTELTEQEAELVNRAIQAYPGGLGYRPDRDPQAIAAGLIEEGRIERLEVTDDGEPFVTYRLRDDVAEEIRRIAAERAQGAGWN